MSSHLRVRSTVISLMFLAAVGCGAVKSAVGVAPPIHSDTFEAVLGHGEFANRSNEAECLAMRAKVDFSRNAFEGSSEMSSVASTPEWKTLDAAYDDFKSNDCPAITDNHDDVSAVCSALGEKVVALWNDVQGTPAWQTAEDNSDYKTLVDQWKEAKSIDCYAH